MIGSAKPVLISAAILNSGESDMSATNCLVPFIDNGGQRSFIERRKKSNILHMWDRRSIADRRKNVDRREVLNHMRPGGPERRVVFLKYF
jgi:hypothetical protein